MRSTLALLAILLASVSQAQDLIDLGPQADGVHHFRAVYQGGKLVQVVGPLPILRPTKPDGTPVPQPPVTPETPLKEAVRKLTREAIDRGGSANTGAKLAAVYAIVSDDCSAGSLKPDLASPLIVAATDAVLKDASDKDAWGPWRTGVGGELAKVPGIGTDKTATATALAEVSSAVKQALNQQVEPGILDRIDWTAIIDLIRPIVRDQLLKLLQELLGKLPK